MSDQDKQLQVANTGYFSMDVWNAMDTMAKMFIQSKSLPVGITNTAQLMLVLQAGHELGLKPVESLNNLYIVNGRVAMQGSAVLRKMLEKGVEIEWLERSATKVKARFTRKGMKPYECEVTMADMDARKVSHQYIREKNEWKRKAVWAMYPENMLMWKVIANGGKFYCADLLTGVEIYEDIIDAEVVEEKAAPATDEKPHQKLMEKISKARRATMDKLEDEVVNGKWGNEAKKELVAALATRRQELDGEVVDVQEELTEDEKQEAKKHAEDAEPEQTTIDVPAGDAPAQPSKLASIFKDKK